MKVRAAVLDAFASPRPYAESSPLTIEELVLDPPGPSELLVRIESAGVCHSDLSVVEGVRRWPLPLALGHEAAGVVEEVGAGVRDVEPDDHVVLTFMPSCGTCRECAGGRPALCSAAAAANAEGRMLSGGCRLHRGGSDVHHHLGVSAFAERAVVARGSAVVVPEDVPLDTAALFGCAVLTGVGAVLETAGVRPGESVAVFGLGGVGLSAVMGAAVAGAHPIVAVDPVADKRALALELGATAALDASGAEEALLDLSGGGVRYAFEAVGATPVLEAAYRCVARGGTTVAIGLPAPTAEAKISASILVTGSRTLVGSYMGSAAPQRDIPRLLDLWRAKRLPVERLQSATLDLEDVNGALDALSEGHVVRQIIRPRS